VGRFPVGARLAAEPLSVAQGFLRGEEKVSMGGGLNAGIATLGDVHVSTGPQRLADIAVQRVDDDFLTAVAQARVR
jgi:hypothetical protein